MSEQPIELEAERYSSTLDLVSAALVAVQGELEAASFDSQNPFLRNRYASLGSIIEASRPVLAKHKLAVQQIPTTPNDGHVSVTTIIRHTSGQWLDGGTLTLPLGEEKGKSMAQVAGSIITYLKRYAWASNLGMYADEDTDGHMPDKPPQKAIPRAKPPEPAQNATPPPKTAPEAHSEPAKGDSGPVVGPKWRMTLLHRLLAAPGEANRGVVTHFLMSRGWITGEQAPEEWPIFTLPKSKEEFDKLQGEIQDFERQMRDQPAVEEPA